MFIVNARKLSNISQQDFIIRLILKNIIALTHFIHVLAQKLQILEFPSHNFQLLLKIYFDFFV